jgi:cytochrome c-type biogenesis protein
MQSAENVTVVMAFAAGVLAFFSPCIFPLIPAYISYLTGMSFNEISGSLSKEKKKTLRRVTVLQSLGFIFGFSVVFVVLGTSATLLGQLLLEYQLAMKRAGGVMVLFFALVIMGVVKLPFLQRERKLSYKKRGISVAGSMLVGATFAAAWTPCVGPILGSILIYASSTASVKTGVLLLIAFSLGLGVPFFLSALIINSFLAYFKKIERYMKWIKIVSGIVLIFFGIVLLTGKTM